MAFITQKRRVDNGLSHRLRGFISIYIVLFFISPAFLGMARGDGVVLAESYRIFYVDENTQYVIINYDKGIQNTFVSINFDWEKSNKTAWIFPVPGDPEDINIDVADGVPTFRGEDVVKEAITDLDDSLNYFQFAYIFSFLLYIKYRTPHDFRHG